MDKRHISELVVRYGTARVRLSNLLQRQAVGSPNDVVSENELEIAHQSAIDILNAINKELDCGEKPIS